MTAWVVSSTSVGLILQGENAAVSKVLVQTFACDAMADRSLSAAHRLAVSGMDHVCTGPDGGRVSEPNEVPSFHGILTPAANAGVGTIA